MIGFYNYSVILTYLGLGSAITGIVFALEKQPKLAVLCLLICGLCDMFDGTIARTCKRSDDAKRFGVQIDSLCDLVCFGVFPAMIGWAIGPASWCKCLGHVMDLDFDECKGCIRALIVPGPARFCGLFGRDCEFFIPWCDIVRIGPDIILVDVKDENIRHKL